MLSIIAGVVVDRSRSKFFSKEFMEKHFREKHDEAFPDGKIKLCPSGFPDSGNGVYADCLSYADWFNFSLKQRAHKNSLETVSILCFCLIASGMVFPHLTLAFAILNFVGRIAHMVGYCMSAKARTPGAITILTSAALIQILGVVSTIFWIVENFTPKTLEDMQEMAKRQQ